jgi:outer membrane protein assembly factor BamB
MSGSTGQTQRRPLGGVRSTVAIALFGVTSLVAAACVGPSAGPATQAPAQAPAQPPSAARSASVAPASPSIASAADWPVYHFDAQRTGNYPSFPTFTGSLAAGWSAALDGAVYAQPLVVNGVVIAATEGDSVYAIDSGTGAVLWHRNLGTPVPLSALPCGNINPLGITGTPAYDSATNSIFVVAEVTGFQHVLSALDPATGAVRWSRDVDLAGDDPSTHQQRPALAVANGYVYIGLGGLAGDCGQYIGEEIGVPTSGVGSTISYRVPTTREGAIWATGGPVIDASGNLYVSVGNGASTTTYDGTDSVLELSPSLQLLSFFAPTSWASDNASDADLGSLSPVVVPGGWVFIAGKSGTGYVMHQGALGGIGGQVSSASVCTGFGGAAYNGDTIYVPCVGSMREVQIGAGGALTAGWSTGAAGGPPVIGGGAVWSVNTSSGQLVALNPATGATLGSIGVGAVPHFVSPTLWQDRIFVGTNAGISSVVVPSVPPTTATFHSLTPVRLLDTRSGNGLSGKVLANTPATFQVGGRGGIPANASAVTGNVTVANPSASWAVYLGPAPVAHPPTSTINFTAGQVTGNGLTVALSVTGSLSATYVSNPGNTTDLIFDATGYFTPDATGATYHAMSPSRLLDTRVGNGISGRLAANTPAGFQVAGRGGVPAGATAVTGNVTVVNPSSAWAVYLGPDPLASPTTSTINFGAGQVKGNSLTVSLSSTGMLNATFMSTPGNTTDLVFDVTGYYTLDATGAKFVPLSPARLVDTRIAVGLAGKVTANTPATFQVSNRGGVPAGATGVTGNVTVVNETSSWAVFVGANPNPAPTTSTLNFNAGEVKGNGLTVGLSGSGTLSATYISNGGNTTDLVFDATGYFVP